LFLPPLQYFENPPNDEDFQFRDPYDFPILIYIFPKETDSFYFTFYYNLLREGLVKVTLYSRCITLVRTSVISPLIEPHISLGLIQSLLCNNLGRLLTVHYQIPGV